MNLPELDLSFDTLPLPGCDGRPADGLSDAGGLSDPATGEGQWCHHLGRWLAQLAPELAAPLQASRYSLGLQITDDATIAALNARWRRVEGPTDVLAFAAQESLADGAMPPPGCLDPQGEEAVELGDIVISLETAARQAQQAGHGLEQELLFLASHGLLHLLGWDHPDESSLAAMLDRQERLLADP